MSKEVRGFVFSTKRNGERTYYPAIKTSHGVALYRKKNSEGAWCGPKLAKTFFEHTWENVTREKIAASRRWAEELDRLMPRNSSWRDDDYFCRICGAKIQERIIHWRFHFGQDQIMKEVLMSLFGNM